METTKNGTAVGTRVTASQLDALRRVAASERPECHGMRFRAGESVACAHLAAKRLIARRASATPAHGPDSYALTDAGRAVLAESSAAEPVGFLCSEITGIDKDPFAGCAARITKASPR